MTEYDRHIGHRQHFDAAELRSRTCCREAGYEVGYLDGSRVPGIQRVPASHARARREARLDRGGTIEPRLLSRFAMRAFRLRACASTLRLSSARLADRRRRLDSRDAAHRNRL